MSDALRKELERLAARLERESLPPELVRRLRALLAECERRAAPRPTAHDEPQGAPLDAAAPIRVWCDGSCAPNPGPGGWGAIVEQEGRRSEISGGSRASTNNIMEMTAAIEALRCTPDGATVHVTTDSRYLMDGITRWLPGWKRKGWRKADGKPVLNQGLWQALDALLKGRRVTWEWVPSHTGHPENERCDELANAARRSL